MGDVAHAAADADHALLIVEFDDLFGEIEVDGAVFVAAGVEEEGQLFHVREMFGEGRVTRGHLGIFLDDFVYVGVGHAFEGTNDSGGHARAAHIAGGIEFHQSAHHQAVFVGLQGAHAVGKRFGEHRDGAVGKINGGAAQTGFLIERTFGANVMGDVGDVYLEMPAAVGAAFDVNSVVEIAGGFAVDGDDGEGAKIFAALVFCFGDGNGAARSFLQDFGGKRVRDVMLANDDFDIDAEVAGAAENFDDASGGRCAATRIAR